MSACFLQSLNIEKEIAFKYSAGRSGNINPAPKNSAFSINFTHVNGIIF